jgi:hypothetical protein
MGLFEQVVAAMSPCWVEYFTTFGLIVAVFLGYRICQGFYNIFNQFVLGRIFGPALDLKKLGKWAGEMTSLINPKHVTFYALICQWSLELLTALAWHMQSNWPSEAFASSLSAGVKKNLNIVRKNSVSK